MRKWEIAEQKTRNTEKRNRILKPFFKIRNKNNYQTLYLKKLETKKQMLRKNNVSKHCIYLFAMCIIGKGKRNGKIGFFFFFLFEFNNIGSGDLTL